MSPRPKEFNPDKALDAAMKLFWRKGYEATSIQDLVEAMNINRFSLYDTFGDKHQLYMAACDRYRRWMDERMLSSLTEAASGLDGLRSFFNKLEGHYSSRMGRRGCFIVNSIVERAQVDRQIARCSQEFICQLEAALEHCLVMAVEAKEISPSETPHELAQHLAGIVQGIGVVGKAFPDINRVRTMIRFALRIIE
ncbi:MAG TPA: TetR/AcrR family transcriptional regulator [candidate division Zixibacteria bacterium]|nr:TetR/AcrR family transcriptional regulator [candidate division Zixibacteria bacterium]